MPSGPPELHEKFCAMSADGSGDLAAIKLLEDAGYKLTQNWTWIIPEDHDMTKEESEAIYYLQVEWDYGWLEPQAAEGEK